MKPCKKVSYSSKHFAYLDIERFTKIEDARDKPIRAYKCERCNTWHLTKSESLNETIALLKIKIEELSDDNRKLSTRVVGLIKWKDDLSWFKKYSKLKLRFDKLQKQSLIVAENKQLHIALSKIKKDLMLSKKELCDNQK